MVAPVSLLVYLAQKFVIGTSTYLAVQLGKILLKEPPPPSLASELSPSYSTFTNRPSLGVAVPSIYGQVTYVPYEIMSRAVISERSLDVVSNTIIGAAGEVYSYSTTYLIGRGVVSDFEISSVRTGGENVPISRVSVFTDLANSSTVVNGVSYSAADGFSPQRYFPLNIIAPISSDLRRLLYLSDSSSPLGTVPLPLDDNDPQLDSYPTHIVSNPAATFVSVGIRWIVGSEPIFSSVTAAFMQFRRTVPILDSSGNPDRSWSTVEPGILVVTPAPRNINRTLNFSLPREIGYDGTYQVRFLIPSIFFNRLLLSAEGLVTERIAITSSEVSIQRIEYGVPQENIAQGFVYASVSTTSENLEAFSPDTSLTMLIRRRLFTYDPVNGISATRVATDNPAWVFMNMIDDVNVNGRILSVDRDDLFRLSSYYQDNGFSFNYVFDVQGTLYDNLKIVAFACNSLVVVNPAGYSLLPDIERPSLNLVFNVTNIVSNSFAANDLIDNTAPVGTILGTYRSSDSLENSQITYIAPQSEYPRDINSERVVTVDMPGINNATLATTTARSLFKSLFYRNCVVEFHCHYIEGSLLSLAQNVLVSHPILNINNQYGAGSFTFGSEIVIAPSSSHDLNPSSTYEIIVLNQKGQILVQKDINDFTKDSQGVITITPDVPIAGVRNGFYNFIIGTPGEVLTVCNIVSIRRSPIGLFVIQAAIEDTAVYED